MKKIIVLAMLSVFCSSCASILSLFSAGSMVSGQTAHVMPSERKAIIKEAKKQALEELKKQKSLENS